MHKKTNRYRVTYTQSQYNYRKISFQRSYSADVFNRQQKLGSFRWWQWWPTLRSSNQLLQLFRTWHRFGKIFTVCFTKDPKSHKGNNICDASLLSCLLYVFMNFILINLLKLDFILLTIHNRNLKDAWIIKLTQMNKQLTTPINWRL